MYKLIINAAQKDNVTQL